MRYQHRVAETAHRAKAAAATLAGVPAEQRNGALDAIAHALSSREREIVVANAKDLEAARSLVASGAMRQSLFRRLILDAAKLRDVVASVEQVATLPDPLHHVTLATALDDGLTLERVTCPIGVIGVVFESRPDALPQIASLCLKSGNAVVLKGGSEAEHSNRILANVIRDAATDTGIPENWLALLETREDVAGLLQADDAVDLIVPRGSSALVRHIQANTRIPVLGHAEGICHVYVDAAADLEKALAIAVDSKVQYPAACNAAETLLVHRAVAAAFLPRVAPALARYGVEIRCDASTRELLHGTATTEATAADWDTEHGDLVLTIRTVESLADAISHINQHGSRHTETIVTEDRATFDRFFATVNSAGVFLNASTRFADGFRYGFGAEVGISTGKLHPRGPVGLDGLVTYKYRVMGDGHVVATYAGANAKPFLHRSLPIGDPVIYT